METKEKRVQFWQRARAVLLNNFWLKLISLLMALTLWFIVTGGPKREEMISIRLGLERYVPAGWAIASSYDDEAILQLRGRDDGISRLLDPGAVNRLVSINIASSAIEPKRGVQRIQLNTSDVSLPSGVEVLSIDPSVVLLQLDQVATAEKPVRIVVEGTPKQGFRMIGEPVADPAEITVTGAQSLVDSIEFVEARVSLNERGLNDGVAAITLQRNPLVRYSSNAVEVALDIVENNESRSFTLNPQNFIYRDGTSSYTVDVDPLEIVLTVEGPSTWVNTLRPEEIQMVLTPRLVTALGRRTPVTFNEGMVSFVRPVRRELISVQANPAEFVVVVSQAQ